MNVPSQMCFIVTDAHVNQMFSYSSINFFMLFPLLDL